MRFIRETKIKRNAGKAAAVLAAAALLGTITACSKQGQPKQEPVIGTLGTEDSSLAEAAEEIHNTPVSAQVEAPSHYETKIENGMFTLTADSPVTADQADSLGVRSIRQNPYTQEDLDHFLKVLEGEGISFFESVAYLQEADDDALNHTYFSEDGAFHLSFVSGGQKGTTPIFWLTSQEISDGSDDSFWAADVSGMNLSDQEQEALKAEMASKAEALLSQLDQETFALCDTQWRALRRKDETQSWSFEGDYGIRLTYVRTADGIILPNYLQSSGGGGSCQYITFLYSTDGQLLVLKDISREIVGEPAAEDFFLPFTAVAQIFEQYSKTHYEEFLDPYKKDGIGDLSKFAINVEEVRLEYRLQMEENQSEGQLIPVWNFIGSGSISQMAGTTELKSRPILILDARDGSILQTWTPGAEDYEIH